MNDDEWGIWNASILTSLYLVLVQLKFFKMVGKGLKFSFKCSVEMLSLVVRRPSPPVRP